MAICSWCSREMTDPQIATCEGNLAVAFPDGASLPSVPFAPDPRLSTEEWMAQWRALSASGDTEEAALGRCAEYQARWGRCPDCAVSPGGRHHPGCDGECCPRCGGQLIGCGCLGD